ncbi:MAG: hypothetical protein J2P23_08125 [Microlunatus sp.]|nr:hypothetical protein [Microlunatus sp.]
MRPEVLNTGYPLRARLIFGLIKIITRHPLPDAAKINFYRPDFYGAPMGRLTQQVMRGPSGWSVGDRELMAAYISRVNGSAFCTGAHTATATGAFGDHGLVAQTLDDLDSAPIREPLRAMLRLLGMITRGEPITADDVGTVLATGATRTQLEDALAVCFAFNVINRLADAFDFARLTPEGYASGANHLLRRGYQ